jgi:hypothetical protein
VQTVGASAINVQLSIFVIWLSLSVLFANKTKYPLREIIL